MDIPGDSHSKNGPICLFLVIALACYVMRFLLFICFSSSLFSCGTNPEPSKPNILLLVADDLAYSDFSFLGSVIQTPNLDRLVSEGVFFSRFHTAPVCTPSYSMLLSGNDNHVAGLGAQWNYDGSWGYEGKLSDRVITFPQLLQQGGYRTYFSGKWGMGTDSLNLPPRRGFDKSLVWLTGTQYGDKELKALEDGEPFEWSEGAYTTTTFVDYLIKNLSANKAGNKPFFAMAGFTSPHWPLQVDKDYWVKYSGKFDMGYENLRKDNIDRLVSKGYFPTNAKIPEIHQLVTPWDSLSDDQKKKESRKMELYAGMVDNLDYEIGRLIDFLKKSNQYENTIIIFLSDNGAAAEDFYNYEWNVALREKYSNDYENMGDNSSYVAYGPQWAEAGSGPFKYFKGFATEGGILAPMFIVGNEISRESFTYAGLSTIQDIAPTILEFAGINFPEREYGIRGESIAPFLLGKSNFVHDSTFVFAQEHLGEAMVIQWPWKLVTSNYQFSKDEFSFHNLIEDPGEVVDLSDTYPQLKSRLFSHWESYVVKSRVKTK